MRNQQTKKHGPNERTNQNSRKRAKQVGDNTQPIRLAVHNTGDQAAQGTSEELSSIKKTPPGTKGTLTKIKNNLQGNNSRVDEAENHINDLEHKEPKTTHQNNRKKKESRKMRRA